MKKYTSLLSMLILALAVFWGFYDMMPASVSKANSTTDFSVENALSHLKVIAKEPHYVGSPGHTKVRDYIFNQLDSMGLNPSIQFQSVVNRKWFAGTTAENILARIKGTEDGKALLLLTHYDSSQHSSKGASDAGSGVVTILEGVRAFLARNEQPKNDIIILISDAEELGLLGAKAFVNHHPWAKEVGLVLNFEARGSGGPSYMLMETNGKNQRLISEFTKANPGYPSANSLMYSIYKKLPNDTDLTVFREEGNINGFNFAFIGDHFDYHTAQDSFERLDRATLQHQADYLMTTLDYFAFSDISNFDANQDHVYVNFPLLKLVHYPFSWVLPMLIACVLAFLVLVFLGLGMNRLQMKSILIGLVPALLSVVGASGVSFLLWKLVLLVHPGYTDMLHGFTYNGYWYIWAFAFLSIWMVFFIYKAFSKKGQGLNLFIAPIFLWLVINFLILEDYKGAGFFIFPVIVALLILASEIFKKSRRNRNIIYAIFSIPTLYIFAPMVKLFPVGLGLGTLFLSTVFVALLFGLLIPIVTAKGARKGFARLSGLLAVLFFVLASFNSGFDKDNKKPNSLVYVKNIGDDTAIWGTYNKVLDAYTHQKLGDSPKEGGIANAETKSKYNTRFRYFEKAESLAVGSTMIAINTDTLVGTTRKINLSLIPQRKVNKFELSVRDTTRFEKLVVNGAQVNGGKSFTVRRGSFLIYHMANTDDNLDIEMHLSNNAKPIIVINDISYDLLTHPLFSIKARSEEMMPMPFVSNDAIMTTQELQL